MVLTLIKLYHHPFFQLVIMTLLSILNLGYIIVQKPYVTDQENRIQIYSETMVYAYIWMTCIYLIVVK